MFIVKEPDSKGFGANSGSLTGLGLILWNQRQKLLSAVAKFQNKPIYVK